MACQERECGQKRQYRNERVAGYAAERATERCGETIHTYLCRWCAWWHIGHALPAVARLRMAG